MKKALLTHILTPAVITILMLSCSGGNRYRALLDRADSLMAEHPDSAYALLASIDSADMSRQRKAVRMRYELQRAEAQNKLYLPFTTDSVLREVVRYYDSPWHKYIIHFSFFTFHSASNEALKSRYLLGCAYRDLHETPRAIECYQDAIDCADTTSADCDFKTLSCVYSQMADQLRRQLALSNAIESRRLSIKYSLLIKDTLNALYDMTQMTTEYMMLNKKDSAEAIFSKAKSMYLENGYQREWATASLPLAYIYLTQPLQLNKAKDVLDLYKAESGMFSSDGYLPPSECMYYYYRGLYLEKTGNLDSAEYFYRQMYYPNMEYTHEDAMYRGLFRIFEQKADVDSIYKYSLLYCQANDSSIAHKDTELIVQMQASYNYGRLQQEAIKQKEKAAEAREWLAFFITFSVILIFLIIHLRNQHVLKQKELALTRQKLKEAKEAYQKEVKELELLEENHRKVVGLMQLDLQHSQSESELYHLKYQNVQKDLAEINSQYEASIKSHKDEIERMKAKIESLNIEDRIKNTTDYQNSAIAQKLQHMATRSQFSLSELDWNTLILEFGTHYPKLFADLNDISSVNENASRVCILITAGLRESAIANFLNIGDTAVSNYKSDINLALFGEKSARTLYKNLKKHYGL